MYNYEHESKEINDRYIKYFIYSDYFHDSLIKSIKVLNEGKIVCLELSCEREWPEHNWSQYAADDNYIYKLNFMGCCFIEYQRKDLGSYAEYLNGRFKRSAKLMEMNKALNKKHLHLRIRLADGYLDIIFSKFEIIKLVNSFELPKRLSCDWHFDSIRMKFKNVNIDEIRQLAESAKFPLKSYALEYLWIENDECVENLAMKALSDEDARVPAIFVLGEIGTIKTIQTISSLLSCEDCGDIFYRHIKDAIGKILYRYNSMT